MITATVRPHVIVVYSGGVPTALMCGRLEAAPKHIKAGYLTLRLPKVKTLIFVSDGWLGDISEVNSKSLVGSIVESLSSGEADVAILYHPDLNSPLVKAARTLPKWFQRDYAISPQIHRVRDLKISPGGFLASISSKERNNQKRRTRKLGEVFRDVHIDPLKFPDDFERMMRDAEAVASRSYQRNLNVGFINKPDIRSILEFEAQKGWLRAFILYLDHKPCAFFIGSLRERTFLCEYIAVDWAYEAYTPGMYLILEVLEDISRQRHGQVDLIDFGSGDAPWKERFGNRFWQESYVHIFNLSVKGTSINAVQSLVAALRPSIKGLLGTAGILDAVKRTWRGHLARK
ncbi:GNAT family N-acetyltransferase [Bradyrhizobium sp. ARR65]|uniref:GNAT family N-acetyltransferase n=1 Tax=Bradyrhizobium sp. ARR65 TaxID=1040989 RepID=UPI0018DB2594|nr:GNAT family N-acetyltransferase [Bradyrhizobium sp. ARR65]